MTTAYFLKLRTTKKACRRSSFQTARVRRLVRRKHRGELAPQTRNAYLPRNSPHCKETSSCQLSGTIKRHRQHSPCTFALYHTFLALSIKYERMFAFYSFNFKNPCSKALPAKVLCRAWFRIQKEVDFSFRLCCTKNALYTKNAL